MVTGFTDDKGQFRPTGGNSGISESSFHEGTHTNVLGTPVRKYSSAVPTSEKQATLNKVSAYVKGFNKRVKEANSSGQARKDEQKARKEKMQREADKNMELAAKFFNNAEALKHGKTPTEEIKINIENNSTHEKLPKHVTAEQKKKEEKKKEAQQKTENKIVENIAKSNETKEPDIPIMPEGVPQYSQSNTQQEKSQSSQNNNEEPLEVFPVSF